ncbi:MAG TPA: hypothetical protein VF193_05610 [Steroidobacter sp.]
MAHRLNLALGLIVGAALCVVAAAQDTSKPIDKIKALIVDRNPQTRVEKVNYERRAVRRLDVVDENGVRQSWTIASCRALARSAASA